MIVQMKITIGLALLNIALLLGIIILNLGSYKKMRAQYTLFVITFASLFLLQYIIGAVLYFTNIDIYPMEISAHMLTLTAIQTIAFGYLLWMEWQ